MSDCYFGKSSPIELPQWPLLGSRYQVLGLLGKGGFAEVYKAYDCVEFEYVVCKLIILDRNMEPEIKEAFVKYAKRENFVFQSLSHPNIVRYIDTVDYDPGVICTILEYCEGGDLSKRL